MDSKQFWTLVGCPKPSRNFRFQVFFPVATTNRGFRCFFPAPETFGHWLSHLFRCLWENITTDTSSLALAFRARSAAKKERCGGSTETKLQLTRTRIIQPLPPPPPPLQKVFLGHGFHRSKMDPLKQQLTIPWKSKTIKRIVPWNC